MHSCVQLFEVSSFHIVPDSGHYSSSATTKKKIVIGTKKKNKEAAVEIKLKMITSHATYHRYTSSSIIIFITVDSRGGKLARELLLIIKMEKI